MFVYRVKKASINAANVISGTHPKKIFKLFIAPIFRETLRGNVPGKISDAPKTNPAVPSINIDSISMVPCCQMVRNDS